MLFNKWIRFAMSAAMAVVGVAMTMDWSSVVSAGTAGKIVGGLGMAKMIMDGLAPAAGVPVQSTGGAIITHN